MSKKEVGAALAADAGSGELLQQEHDNREFEEYDVTYEEEVDEVNHDKTDDDEHDQKQVIEHEYMHGGDEHHEGHDEDQMELVDRQVDQQGHHEHEQVQQQQEVYSQQDYELVENLQRGIQYVEQQQQQQQQQHEEHEYHGELTYGNEGGEDDQDEHQQAAEYMLHAADQNQPGDVTMQSMLPEHSGVGHTLATVSTEDVDSVQAAHEAASHVLSSFTQSYVTSAPHGANQSIVAMGNGSQHHGAQEGMGSVLDVKTLTPKFNRGRNWSREETRLLLDVLLREVNMHPEDRRDLILRRPETFEHASEVLRENNFMRDQQACLVRWRNLLRIYKQQRAATNEGNGDVQSTFPFATEIEQIYQFSPDSLLPTPGRAGSVGNSALGTPTATGQARTWSQANGLTIASYSTPSRKRPREAPTSMGQRSIERLEQKLDQQSELIKSQEQKIEQLEAMVTKQTEILRQLQRSFINESGDVEENGGGAADDNHNAELAHQHHENHVQEEQLEEDLEQQDIEEEEEEEENGAVTGEMVGIEGEEIEVK